MYKDSQKPKRNKKPFFPLQVGPSGAAQALGFMKGVMGISFAAGPPIAGALYDALGDYFLAFLLAGVPPILAGLAMTYITSEACCNSSGSRRGRGCDPHVLMTCCANA